MFTDKTLDDVCAELGRAVHQHGRHTPLHLHDSDNLVLLVEEVGEVAAAMTCDNPHSNSLGAELLQVATMSLAWYQQVNEG